jgi:Ca-activated chloride channel homolog
VNADVKNKAIVLLAVMLLAGACYGASAAKDVRAGNGLYAKKDWQGAIAAYDKAMVDEPTSLVPKFNKGNALFESGDIAAAMDSYKQVSAEAKEMDTVARAKYNLGNCYFKEGLRQKDSDLKKAKEAFVQAMGSWRDTIELLPKSSRLAKNAAKNIDVAGVAVKEMNDKIKKRQEQQKNDPNGQQQQQQNQQQQQGEKDQKQGQDPNSNQKQDAGKKEEEKKDQDKKEGKEQQPQKAEEKKDAPDATAEQILNDEQERKKDLRHNQPGGYAPVEQDW